MRGVTKRQERDSSKPRTLRLPCFCASGGQRHVPGPCPRGVMSPEPPSVRGWGSSQTCIAEGQALHPILLRAVSAGPGVWEMLLSEHKLNAFCVLRVLEQNIQN